MISVNFGFTYSKLASASAIIRALGLPSTTRVSLLICACSSSRLFPPVFLASLTSRGKTGDPCPWPLAGLGFTRSSFWGMLYRPTQYPDVMMLPVNSAIGT